MASIVLACRAPGHHFINFMPYFNKYELTNIMLLVANLSNTKRFKNLKMTETLAHGYSSESTW